MYSRAMPTLIRFIDPFGHRWAVAQRVRDVPHDEVVRLAAAAFGSADAG